MKLLLLLLIPILGKISVFSPEEMRNEFIERHPMGEIPASLGNFGNPPYGSSLVGRVYYPIQFSDQDGCSPLIPINFSHDSSNPDLVTTPILMLDRGYCSFVVKVRHAEDIGAKLVLIANDDDSDPESIIMTDNGQGGNLQIPALLISKDDAGVIKRYLHDTRLSSHISLSVSFDMHKESGVVKYSIWTSPTSYLSRQFMAEFALEGSKLPRKVAEFTPHFVFWYCADCMDQGFVEDHPDCVSGGRYCFPDPDYEGYLTGRDVMLEDLRQLCIHKLYSQSDYKTFFKYQREYHFACAAFVADPECSRKVMATSGISSKNVEDCVADSFLGNNIALDDNKILRVQMQALIDTNIPYFPSVVVNEQLYRGDLEGSAVMDAVCAGYIWGSEPKACLDRLPTPDVNDEQDNGNNTILIILLVVGSLLIVAGILVIYKVIVKKDLNRDMKVQVNNTVAQYFQLAELPRT